MKDEALISSLRAVIEDSLRSGVGIEIDGIGTLERDSHGHLIFKRNSRARVFLAYAQEDRESVKRLYDELNAAGFAAWMDVQNLLPGQNWPRAIERAIETADYFIGCFSSRSSDKRGHFQAELSYALDMASHIPADHAFVVPVRLDKCNVPVQIARKVHYMDLFPDWKAGSSALIYALHAHEKIKKQNSEASKESLK